MPDVELVDPVEVVLGFLKPRVDVPVRAQVPSSRPARFVTVMRAGGPVLNRILEAPLLTIQTWGESIADASDLASAVKNALLNGASEMPLVRSVEVQSVYNDPDPDSEQSRYTVSARLLIRGRRR